MSIIDVDAMLDGNLSEVQAAPDYVTPPSGTANVRISEVKAEKFEKAVRDEEGKPTGAKEDALRIRMTREIVEYIEYAEDNALPVNPGSLYSDTYMYDEKGLPLFKRDAAAVLGVDAGELDDLSLRDLFEALQQTEAVTCVIKTSTVKRGENEFTNTKTTVVDAG